MFVRVCHSPRVVWTVVVIDERSVLQVLHIASLAHLELEPGSAELQRMVSDVREILRFTRQLSTVVCMCMRGRGSVCQHHHAVQLTIRV